MPYIQAESRAACQQYLVCRLPVRRRFKCHFRDAGLLSQALCLNDDLQRVLAKHDAIAAGIAVPVEKQRSLHAALAKPDTTKEAVQRLAPCVNHFVQDILLETNTSKKNLKNYMCFLTFFTFP